MVATATGTGATTTGARNKRVVGPVAGDQERALVGRADRNSGLRLRALGDILGTLAPGVGPGFTSAHGLRGPMNTAAGSPRSVMRMSFWRAGSGARVFRLRPNRLSSTVGTRSARPAVQVVDDLRAEPLVLGPLLQRAGIGARDLTHAGLRPPDVDVVGTDVGHDARGVGGIDRGIDADT